MKRLTRRIWEVMILGDVEREELAVVVSTEIPIAAEDEVVLLGDVGAVGTRLGVSRGGDGRGRRRRLPGC